MLPECSIECSRRLARALCAARALRALFHRERSRATHHHHHHHRLDGACSQQRESLAEAALVPVQSLRPGGRCATSEQMHVALARRTRRTRTRARKWRTRTSITTRGWVAMALMVTPRTRFDSQASAQLSSRRQHSVQLEGLEQHALTGAKTVVHSRFASGHVQEHISKQVPVAAHPSQLRRLLPRLLRSPRHHPQMRCCSAVVLVLVARRLFQAPIAQMRLRPRKGRRTQRQLLDCAELGHARSAAWIESSFSSFE